MADRRAPTPGAQSSSHPPNHSGDVATSFLAQVCRNTLFHLYSGVADQALNPWRAWVVLRVLFLRICHLYVKPPILPRPRTQACKTRAPITSIADYSQLLSLVVHMGLYVHIFMFSPSVWGLSESYNAATSTATV